MSCFGNNKKMKIVFFRKKIKADNFLTVKRYQNRRTREREIERERERGKREREGVREVFLQRSEKNNN